MVCVSTDMLESLGEVLPCILGDYPLRQDQCLVGDRYGYLVEPLAEKPSGRDILSIDISELPDLGQYSHQGIDSRPERHHLRNQKTGPGGTLTNLFEYQRQELSTQIVQRPSRLVLLMMLLLRVVICLACALGI